VFTSYGSTYTVDRDWTGDVQTEPFGQRKTIRTVPCDVEIVLVVLVQHGRTVYAMCDVPRTLSSLLSTSTLVPTTGCCVLPTSYQYCTSSCCLRLASCDLRLAA
jgi:hypothetical protein